MSLSLFSRSAKTCVCLLVTMGLVGCSGFDGAVFPSVTTPGSLGAIQGSVYGGHTPIVGAHLFVMEATAAGTAPAGYAAAATSLLGAGTGINLDETGGATNGLYYITTDSTGSFNISGDYACTGGQPVYVYAASGAANVLANPTTIVVASAAVTKAAAGTNYTYTIVFTGPNSLAVGQQVTLSVTGVGNTDFQTYLTSYQNVTAATAATFTIQYSSATNNLFGTGGTAASATGTAIPGGTNNPAIVNLAMLGNCPAGGNFASTISYVFLNEVSTAAEAFAMAGFGTDGLHIGSSATNLAGLQVAASTAGSLYNIQGGGGALTTTPGGNGTVPQTKMNTLGNILAACVDSTNTSVGTTAVALTAESTACRTLFEAATSNGAAATSGATVPIDIATAAFNMSHNAGSPGVIGLWNLAGSNTPFSPFLGAAPNDFTVGISYPVTAPGGVALDAAGDVYVATKSTTAGYVTKFSPLGALLNTSATGGTGMSSVAIDPSGNVWASAKTSNALYKYTSTLGAVTGSPYTNAAMANPNQVAIDTTGDVYVAQTFSGNVGSLVEFSNAGALLYNVDTNSNAAFATSVALDKVTGATDVWLVSNQNNDVTLFNNPSTGSGTTGQSNGYSGPGGIGVDSAGNAWVSNSQSNRPLYRVSPSGIANYYGVDSGGNTPIGGISSPTWVAVDGSENIWVTNSGNSSVTELLINASPADSSTALSPSTGFQNGALSGASAIALDASGNVWITNATGNNVTEIVGAATPVTTPFSAQKPGVKP